MQNEMFAPMQNEMFAPTPDEEAVCRDAIQRLHDILRVTTDAKARDAIRQVIDDLEKKLDA
jgi:hypothetical protein